MLRPSMTASHVEKIFSQAESHSNPSALVSSWRRCISLHGLVPNGARQPERVEHQKIIHSRQRNEAMTRVAGDTIDHLIGVLDGADYMVFLTDADGIVLDTRTLRTGDFWDRPCGDWIGTDFSETANGTNGVGTVLREGRPMTVAADEHFQVRDVTVICSGAPIYGLDGLVAGCLDISSSATRNDPLANSLMLAAAVDAARRIELRMLSNAHPRAKLVMASQTGMHQGAMLAVDPKGAVVGATRAARILLSLKPDQLDGNRSVESLWQNESEDLSWTTAERRAIEVALRTAKGNASAAARALGMGRSTLYRKMEGYKLGDFVGRMARADVPCPSDPAPSR